MKTADEKALLFLLQQAEKERVSPKLEAWRNHYTFKVAEGGRGAGAKTWSAASLLIQKYNYAARPLQCLCVREFMNSLTESSYAILKKTVQRLGYYGWNFTREKIENTINGSYFIFRGLRDLRAAEQLKSYEGFDDVFADEATAISMESWGVLVPTIRKPDREFWITYNRVLEADPCHEYFVINRRPNTSYIHLEPGEADNPWWHQTTLPDDMKADFERDQDEAEHIWYGLPRKQGHNAIMSRVLVRQAMDREINPVGAEEAGIDVARMGDDRTVMYLRKGLKVIKSKVMRREKTIEVANAAWDFVDRRKDIPIKIDEGYNPGVADVLEGYGAQVVPLSFGATAADSDKYGNLVSEMWFDFPLEEADIPEDPELLGELSGRLFKYDKQGRKIAESKDDYKKRFKKSPDKADALILCFYEAYRNSVYSPSAYGMEDLGL